MKTLAKSTHSLIQLTADKTKANSSTKLWKDIEFNRFGIIPMLLATLGCMGGIAVAFGAGDNIFKLSMIAFPTISAVSLVLGLSPMKYVLYTSLIAISLDIVLLIF